MNPTDSDPFPRDIPRRYEPIIWPIKRAIPIHNFPDPKPELFSEIVHRRRSIRRMTHASLREIANFLDFATRINAVRINDAFGRSRRPSISAGALHPIHICVVTTVGRPRVFQYDSTQRTINALSVSSSEVHPFVLRVKSILPEAHASILGLLAETDKVDSAYGDYQSLIWRDAGALLQMLHLSATAFRLAFCPVGILGYELAHAIFPGLTRVIPTGLAVVGRSQRVDNEAISRYTKRGFAHSAT